MPGRVSAEAEGPAEVTLLLSGPRIRVFPSPSKPRDRILLKFECRIKADNLRKPEQ